MLDFKSLYGMDYDKYMALAEEARGADDQYMNRASGGYAGNYGWNTGVYAAEGADPRANIALYNAIKAKDKRLYGADGEMSAAPEIQGVMVHGPMTEQMRAAKNGQWVYAGATPNENAKGALASQWKDLGVDVPQQVERWVYQETPAPQVQQQQEPVKDDPKPQGPTIYDSWDDYINIARAETEGMNRMPFVGPNWAKGNPTYADIEYNPEMSLERFYPGAINTWREKMRDPREGEPFKPVAK